MAPSARLAAAALILCASIAPAAAALIGHGGAVTAIALSPDGARALSAAGLPAAPLYAVAVAMALSRPYLGVHYPSDILAGAALGDAVARFMTP